MNYEISKALVVIKEDMEERLKGFESRHGTMSMRDAVSGGSAEVGLGVEVGVGVDYAALMNLDDVNRESREAMTAQQSAVTCYDSATSVTQQVSASASASSM